MRCRSSVVSQSWAAPTDPSITTSSVPLKLYRKHQSRDLSCHAEDRRSRLAQVVWPITCSWSCIAPAQTSQRLRRRLPHVIWPRSVHRPSYRPTCFRPRPLRAYATVSDRCRLRRGIAPSSFSPYHTKRCPRRRSSRTSGCRVTTWILLWPLGIRSLDYQPGQRYIISDD